MKKIEVFVVVLLVALMAGFASGAIPNPGHKASSVGGDNLSERTFSGNASDSYVFLGGIGIGTKNPDSLLEINGSFKVTNSSDAVLLYVNQTSGYVGVGTTTPSAKLEVYEDINNNQWVRTKNPNSGSAASVGYSATSDTAYVRMTAFSSAYAGVFPGNAAVYSGPTGADLLLGVDGGNVIGITIKNGTGYVGINTSSPTNTLTVAGDLNVTGTSYLGNIEISADQIIVNTIQSKDGNITFENSTGQEKMRITADGKVGIGTTSPGYLLHIVGPASGSNSGGIHVEGLEYAGYFEPTNYDAYAYVGYMDTGIMADGPEYGGYFSSTSGTAGYFTSTSGYGLIVEKGKVGINTTSPANTLNVVGDLNVTGTSYLGNIEITADQIIANTIQSKDGNITFENSTGQEKVRITADGKVGIGTTSPSNLLEVAGARGVGSLISVSNLSGDTKVGMAISSDNKGQIFLYDEQGNLDILINTAGDSYFNGGNVGIGTASPSAKLDINDTGGRIIIEDNRIERWDSDIDTAQLWINWKGYNGGTTRFRDTIIGDGKEDGILFVDGSAGNVGIGTTTTHPFGLSLQASSTDGYFGVSSVSFGDIFVIDENGDVGIGTASPSAKLDVEVSSGGAATIGSSGNTATGDYAVAMGYQTTASGHYSTAIGYQTNASGNYALATGSQTKASGSETTAMGQGTLAIGVVSTAIGGNTIAIGDYSTAMGSSTIASGTDSTAMGYQTTASGQASTAMGYQTKALVDASTAMGTVTTVTGLYSTAMGYYGKAHGAYSFAWGSDLCSAVGTSCNNTQLGVFAIYGGLCVAGSTACPAVSDGNIVYQGSSTQFSDLAEGFPTNKKLDKGDIVVVVDNITIGHTTKPYDTRVAGIISTTPNIVFNFDGETNNYSSMGGIGNYTMPENLAPLSIAGRVPTKVSTENGNIEPGDLLTTSSTLGHAMKFTLLEFSGEETTHELAEKLNENEKRRNSILGKALEPCNDKTCKITALVTLQ